MRIINFLPAIFIVAFFSCCSSQQEVSFTDKWDTIRVLKNPDKGWYHHLLDNGIDKYPVRSDSVFKSFPGMDHLYLRLAWSYLEPEEGKYDWHRIDEVIEKYVPQGYKISFRITSKETGTYPGTVNQQVDGVQYAAPYWLKKAGAKGTVAENWGVKSWVPKWNDPVYLQKLDNFQKAFAERYDGKPWLSYVDIGSIGEWGEGHTHFSTRMPPTVEEVKSNIDVYLKNFKKSQLICTDDLLYYGKNDSDVRELYNYAVSNGISLRDDSPLVDWYLQNNLKTWSVSHPQFYDSLYLSKPIVFELQHYGEVKKDGNWIGKNGSDTIKKYGYSGADILRKAIETMHATYIGYHGYAEEWLTDNPELTNELANRCGYWYFPVKASFNPEFQRGENFVSINWLNKGIAPAYKNFQIEFLMENKENGNIPVQLQNAQNTSWFPDSVITTKYRIIVPPNIQGAYKLKFKLITESEINPAPIDIGLKKTSFNKNGYVEIGTINIKNK